jgi:hypothetical protein
MRGAVTTVAKTGSIAQFGQGLSVLVGVLMVGGTLTMGLDHAVQQNQAATLAPVAAEFRDKLQAYTPALDPVRLKYRLQIDQVLHNAEVTLNHVRQSNVMQISENRVDIGRDQRDMIDIGRDQRDMIDISVPYAFSNALSNAWARPAPANDDKRNLTLRFQKRLTSLANLTSKASGFAAGPRVVDHAPPPPFFFAHTAEDGGLSGPSDCARAGHLAFDIRVNPELDPRN